MDADQLPVVQGQQEQAETAEQTQQTGEGQPAGKSGVQKRIDELTAARYEVERAAQAQAAELQRTIAEKEAQMAHLLEMLARNTQPAAHNPALDVAPEDRQRIEALVDPKVKALENRLAQVTEMLERQEFQTRAAGEDPRIVQRANELAAQWRRAGLPGWKMTDALVYARGELAGTDQLAVQRARDERGRFAQTAQQVVTSQAAPPPPVQQPKGIPADIDRRPLSEQLALYEAALDGKVF